MKYLLFILLSFQFLIAQVNKDSGYFIYQVSLTQSYSYPDIFREETEIYGEALKRDSLMNSIQFGVVFSKGISQSFRLKNYDPNSLEYDAVYKSNLMADYNYDTKTNVSTASMDYWLKLVTISINLKDKWKIDYKRTKTIDGHKCYYAAYNGKGIWWELKSEEPTYAWFTADIPLPYGPLHYNGLPGLILELNVENVRYTATKIAFDNKHISELKSSDMSKYETISEDNFINKRMEIRNRAKRIMIGD